MGVVVGLYGMTGSGKTTLAGEWAKEKFRNERQRTILHSSDKGGYQSLAPLVNLGVIEVDTYQEEKDDPWLWVNAAVSTPPSPDVGLEIFDSATSICEGLLKNAANADLKIGAQNTQKFKVTKGDTSLEVGANNMNHYGIIQTYMLDMIWKSTWKAQKGVDILWTFSTDKGENSNDLTVIGPKLAGHALTAEIPKWFTYFFRLSSVPQLDGPPSHVLYLQENQENGMLGFGNARYPLDARTPLPDRVEPASLVEALRLIAQGELEAEDVLREELGL